VVDSIDLVVVEVEPFICKLAVLEVVRVYHVAYLAWGKSIIDGEGELAETVPCVSR
jgi:hypothetical protein